MILDNSGIDYSRMLLFLFGFLVYWKLDQILSTSSDSAWQHLVYDLITKRLRQSCKRQQFLGFITINK